jgi:Isopentenyldiphosphate isomerase
MLLQQRAHSKYHSGGLWTNACCSHPGKNEDVAQAAARRLQEELGFSVPLKKIFDFIYRSELENGLTEHEFDHVFAGYYEGEVAPDQDEVKDYCYKSLDAISESLQTNPQQFTAWFQIAFPRVEQWRRGLQKFKYMHWLLYILILAGTFIIMEGITWLTHKFVMHGWLWSLHRDHHQPEPGFFEKNDAFFVIFAIPSILCILFGTIREIYWLQAIGLASWPMACLLWYTM